MAAEFPPEFTAIPLEDIDPYYQNKKVTNSFVFFIDKSTNVEIYKSTNKLIFFFLSIFDNFRLSL